MHLHEYSVSSGICQMAFYVNIVIILRPRLLDFLLKRILKVQESSGLSKVSG